MPRKRRPKSFVAKQENLQDTPDSKRPSQVYIYIAVSVAILAAATAARIYGARNDLWLDEIWSLRLVATISSPWGVFTKIHHDNNHYLNSLWVYFCGFKGNWPGYRIPSIVAGVCSVILAGLIGRQRNVPAALFAMLLTASSYVQILYSSEERGYAEVVFFSFLSFYALENYLDKRRWQYALLFSISAILGFASHLIFLEFFCAAALWSAWRLTKHGQNLNRAIAPMLACYAAPSVFFLALYFIDVRWMIAGGGTVASLPNVYASSLAWTLGAPPGHFFMLLTSLAAAVLFAVGVWILRSDVSDAWIFFIGVILVMPILFALIRHTDVYYVRHFIIGMAFSLILYSYVLASLYQRALPWRIVSIILLAGYFAVNIWHTIILFEDGRGHYDEAVRFMAEHTTEPAVTIAGDHDFRIPMVLQFYESALGGKQGKYYRQNSWSGKGPEWLVFHKESTEEPTPPATQVTDAVGNTYELVKVFPSAPLSGLHWFIYHNLSN